MFNFSFLNQLHSLSITYLDAYSPLRLPPIPSATANNFILSFNGCFNTIAESSLFSLINPGLDIEVKISSVCFFINRLISCII